MIEPVEPRRLLAADLTALHVSAGGVNVVDSIGRAFVADSASFAGGQAVQPAVYDVANTTDDRLFSSYRVGSSFSYNKTIPSGHYAVFLEFAEPTATAAGQRVFDVTAEGAPVLDNFDILVAASGNHTAVARAFDVTVADGQLNLGFTGVTGEALISAIVVVPTDPTDPAAPYSWLSMSDTARAVISQSHLRSIGQGMAIYATENKAAYPANLKTLVDYDLRIDEFANPRTSTMPPRGELTTLEEKSWVTSRNDYIYLGAGKKTSAPANTVLAYENPDRQNGDISILWGDLHVSSMTRSSAAALIGFPDAPPSDAPPTRPVLPTSSLVLQSQSNLRAMGTALLFYANDHRGVYPLDLGTLYRDGYLTDINAFIDPRAGTAAPPVDWTTDQKADWIDANTRYRFHGASAKTSSPPEQLIVSEDPALANGGLSLLSNDGSARFFETRWANEILTNWSPVVKNSSFGWNVGPQAITLLFQSAIKAQSLSSAAIRIENIDTGAVIPASAIAASFASTSQLAVKFAFPGYSTGALPNGNYRAMLVDNQLTDVGGLYARGGGWSLDFYTLIGDANRDRVVTITDFNVLATNFGLSGRNFSQGNFDASSDGMVSITDFNLLATNFGKHVDAPPAVTPASITSSSIGSSTSRPAVPPLQSDTDLLHDAGLLI
jgi:hypothetical protein